MSAGTGIINAASIGGGSVALPCDENQK